MTGALRLYKEWLSTATPEQIAFVDLIYKECEEHYSAGGDTIVECYTPQEILDQFKDLNEVREFCGLKVEQELNARWGENTDPEVERSKKFDEWEKESEGSQP